MHGSMNIKKKKKNTMGNLTVGVNITFQIFDQNIGNFISLLHSLYESTSIEKNAVGCLATIRKVFT